MDLEQMMQGMGPIQEQMRKADEERRQAKLEGSAGGGAIKLVLCGDLSVESVSIAPAAAAAVGDDPGMLEDLIAAACNDALKQYTQRFGATPEEQMQRGLQGSDLASLLGPMLGGLGGMGR